MTFADTFNIRSADVVSLDDVADALDALVTVVATAGYDAGASPITTASTSTTAIATLDTTVTVSSGEAVLVHAWISVSHSVLNARITASLRRGGGGIGVNSDLSAVVSSTDGYRGIIPLFAYESPGAGTHTYQVGWDTNLATAYSRSGAIYVQKIRIT